MKSRLRLNVPLLPVLVLLLIGMQAIDPSRIWKTLLVGLGGAWLLGYLWVRILARSLRLTREIRYGWAQVGDRLEERFTVTNHSFVPALWLEVNDRSTVPGYDASQATGIGGGSTSQWQTDGVCTRRGLYTLGGTTLRTGDPLGIYSLSFDDPASTTLLVMPPVVPLPPITVTPGGYSGEGRPHPRAPEQSVGAASVREYQPGDSIRMIHWPSTARYDKPYIRLFDGTPASDSWILLDLERSVQVGDGPDSTEEHGVILAASLADRALGGRQGVGLVINGRELTWIPPQKNANQRLQIFHSLALAQPGEMELARLLERTKKSFGRQASLVIITASTQPGWLEALASLTWRGITPTVMLLDPRSFGGAQNTTATEDTLQRMGITCHVITQDFLNRPEAHPGQQGRWEWHGSPMGRAVALRTPGNADWRKL
jgi:uncharacterized protein (DUF58 family)